MGPKLDLLVDVPVVSWSTGLKVLNADYAVAIAQPFDYTNVTGTESHLGAHKPHRKTAEMLFSAVFLTPGLSMAGIGYRIAIRLRTE